MHLKKTVRHKRPDMQGPKDITGILSGLKTKKINIRSSDKDETSSKVSIAELKDMETETLPHRSKKRPRSERNTVSLDI